MFELIHKHTSHTKKRRRKTITPKIQPERETETRDQSSRSTFECLNGWRAQKKCGLQNIPFCHIQITQQSAQSIQNDKENLLSCVKREKSSSSSSSHSNSNSISSGSLFTFSWSAHTFNRITIWMEDRERKGILIHVQQHTRMLLAMFLQ